MVGLSVALASSSPSVAQSHSMAFSGKPSGNSPDPRRYRALYPDKWFAFLHQHFRDHLHVAFSFGVSERTGRDWWEGKTGPQGWAVAYAIETIPGAETFFKVAA